jgi:hypothetical protein
MRGSALAGGSERMLRRLIEGEFALTQMIATRA